jgi:transcriptional regulator with XRE-family HTH domain
MLGVSERAILAYETGAFKPKAAHIEELAKIMNVPKALLLDQWTTWSTARRAA